VTINGISFLKQTGGDANVGHKHDVVAYSTARENTCVSMGFVLHYLNADNSTPPQTEFDRAAESAVFMQMMSTFAWLTVPPTPTFTFTPVPPSETPVPPSSTPTTGIPVAAPTITSLHMIDSMNGWALSDQYVVRTTDGGNTWYNVLFESNPPSGYFPSATKGWVISNAFEIIRTTDGGQTWTRYNTPFNGGYIQFLDDNNGFVLYGEASGMQKQAVALYQTTDGGATWTLKYDNNPTIPNPGTTLPFSGHKNGMAFSNTTTGWVGGDYPTNGYLYLFKTTNSGTTWTQVSLPIPTGYESAYLSTTAPKFFDTNNGILPVWMTLGAGMRDLFLYKTTNGGSTWTISSSFARSAEQTDIISTSNTISWDWANVFHATNNAGNAWTTVTPNVNFGDEFRELDFVSATTGWSRLQLADGHTALYRTTDGGSTWNMLYGHDIPTATPTSAPTSLIGPYAVIGVAENDVLNIRQLAGSNYPVVGSFPSDAINVMRTGPIAGEQNGPMWMEVQNPSGGTGWVNAAYLTEYVSQDAFCSDTRVATLLSKLKTSMSQSDGLSLSQLVSPIHGMNVHLWAYQPPVHYTTEQTIGAFVSTEIYNWGSGPRGEPDYGTFKEIIQPKMLDTLNAPNMETYCDNLTKVYPLFKPWPYPGIHYYNLYKPGTPGIDLDFRTWLIGIEYYKGEPYIYGMVNIIWEP